MHWLLPGVAAVASAAFAVAVLRQYAVRRRPHQLAWGIALAMFAVASLALTAGVAAGWTPLSFKVYYLFGAVLNVPWLALGTVEPSPAPPSGAYLAALTVFTLLSVVLVALARVTPADLAGRLVPEGKEFLPVAVRVLAVLGNTVGTLIVVGGAVSSGLALRSRRDLRPRFEGNLLIALGVLLAASGGVFAFLDSSDKLALGLALGASVMYLGFRRASTPARRRSPPGHEPEGFGRRGPGNPEGVPRSIGQLFQGGAPMNRVTLYTRVGCHLCEAAERVLREEQAVAGFGLELVDIDRAPSWSAATGCGSRWWPWTAWICSSTRCLLTCCGRASVRSGPIENTITRA